MKPPFVSRGKYESVMADRERIREERTQFSKDATACARQLERFTRELSDLKEEIALHIVAAKHPSSEATDAHSAAIALHEALQARGIDLRVELARLEGADA